MTAGFVVILGSPNSDKGELTEMGLGRLKLGHEQFMRLSSEDWKILLTGGFGDHFNTTPVAHAEYAKRYLLGCGIMETDLVEPALSCNTVDDALKTRELAENTK